MTEPKVRIFVSSPSDVEHERALVKDIIEALAQEYRPYFQLQAVLWEEEALTAARSFQAGLLRPSECEIVLVMLWTRLGTPLADDPYGGMTGTEWEFVDAVDASARQDTPEVLVYRKTAPRLVDINNAEAIRAAVSDRDRLDVFFRTHFFNPDGSFRRAFRQFENDTAFRDLVETQLRKLLNRRISAERRFAAGVIEWRGSPFRAQGPFDVGDERVFTGRETETRELVARLDGLRGKGQGARDKGQGLLLLTGPSGVGKTSLLRAGLLPHLVRPFLLTGVAACRWCLVAPDPEDPLDSLARALVSPGMLGASLAAFGLDAERLAKLFASAPTVGADQIRAALAQTVNDDLQQTGGREGRLQLAVILDPLDGLFAEARLDAPRTQTFADTLAALAAQEGIWIVAALGSQHLPGLTRFQALTDLLDEQSCYRLEPPALGRIRQVMEIPARVAGIEFEAMGRDSGHGLVEALESEASAVTHWPALLEQTLEDLYRQLVSSETAQDSLLTLRAYQAIGGLSGALLKRADDLWQTLDEETRGALPMLCRALLALEGGHQARASAREGNLQTLLRDDRCATLTQVFIAARLVVAESVWDPAQRSLCPVIEITLGASLRHLLAQLREEWRARFKLGQTADSLDAFLAAPATDLAETESAADPTLQWEEYRAIASFAHPALFQRWGPVRDWLANPDNRRDLTLRSQIARQARLWKRTDCNREYLLGEVGHAAARVFAQAHGEELEPLEQEFLERSWSRLQWQRRRNRRVIGALLAVLMLFAGVALYALWDASRQTLLNRQSGLLREAEIAIGRGNTPEAIRLGLAAGPDLPEVGTDVLSRALSSNRLLAMQRIGDTAEQAFSDDGEYLATLSTGKGAQLWARRGNGFEPASEPASELAGPDLPIHAIRFAGHGERRTLLGIGATGVWRLPAPAGQPPDWSCGEIKETAIALDPEGRFLALAHEMPPDRFAVCLLDLSRPGPPLWNRPQHSAAVRSLDFAPDGTRLVSASRDGLAKVMDTLSGDERLVLPRDGTPGRPALRAVFNADGTRIAVSSLDERVRLYDPSGNQLAELGSIQRGNRRVRIHQSTVRDLAFSPDGLSLAVGDGTGQLVRWDLRTKSAEVIGQHDLGIDRIEISRHPDPNRGEHLILSVSQDRTARLWTLETGRELAVFSHEQAIAEARFSQDGRFVMTTARPDGSARLWSTESANPLAARLDQEDHVWHLAMAETPAISGGDARALLIATAAYDGRVEVWKDDRQSSAAPPVKLKSLDGHQGRVRRVAFSPSARWLTSAGSDGTARLWALHTDAACALRVASQEQVCRTAGALDCPNVYRILFAPDERWLLTASSDPDQPVRFWDPETCSALPLPDIFGASKGRIRSAAIANPAPDATLLATGNDQGRVQLLRRDRQGAWTQVCQWDAHSAVIAELTFSRDGHWLAAASRDGRASLYRIGAGPCGEPRYLDGQAGSLYDVQFAPDGKALATASLESKAHVWSLDGTLLAELGGHTNRVISAQFSPDGRWILTASRDGTVRIWKRPLRAQIQSMDAYLTLDANLGAVTHAAFSPDGQRIGAGYWENAALLWRLWDEDARPDRHLERLWGKNRARLQVIREAIRFRDGFRLER
ncbi:hypothetical protein [Thiocystis violascens]|uniref:WD40 repeat-containing protein n=1 Tax=Thiocystis violascens (strain ATCC 17096 / DSM 198 / 6111) TaxID=765911 RepID=I3YE73_THIV6|nr:hypothetical protein [Thiocystis violascens]AFL75291.1 WD40 repeat-containing protein [Thiocystis violascens DSM 198]